MRGLCVALLACLIGTSCSPTSEYWRKEHQQIRQRSYRDEVNWKRASTQPAHIKPIKIIGSYDLAFGISDWVRDARFRFGENIVLVLCHGAEGFDEEWVFSPGPVYSWPLGYTIHGCPNISVAKGVSHVRKLYPDRTIVLITCNPGGLELVGHPNVYYCRRNVLLPSYEFDRELLSRWRRRAAGMIWEFASGPP